MASTVATEQTCARPPTPQATWGHQIHATGGASGFITMVMVFVRSLCVLCGFWLITHQLDLSYLHFSGVTKWAAQACTIPFALVPWHLQHATAVSKMLPLPAEVHKDTSSIIRHSLQENASQSPVELSYVWFPHPQILRARMLPWHPQHVPTCLPWSWV